MKVDAGLRGNLGEVPEQIRILEQKGYDAALSFETSHDPFLPLLLAAEHSQRIDLMTSIAVAFSRNPMLLAQLGHDLNSYSKGRFILGLGSQIKPHITKRFSMPWSKPAARMRELVLAMRAIWDCWYQGKPLQFRGDFYTHTLMTPMFTPTDIEQGPPRVVIAAVGPLMTEAAAEVADGMLIHSFTNQRYLEQVTLPAVERGLAKAGKDRSQFQLCYPAFVVSGADEKELATAKTAVKKQLAFYGSTPAYRPVLETHGWGDLQSELNAMSKRGQWDEMGALIDEDILDKFAVVGEPERVVSELKSRYGSLVDRFSVTFPFVEPEREAELVRELKSE